MSTLFWVELGTIMLIFALAALAHTFLPGATL